MPRSFTIRRSLTRRVSYSSKASGKKVDLLSYKDSGQLLEILRRVSYINAIMAACTAGRLCKFNPGGNSETFY